MLFSTNSITETILHRILKKEELLLTSTDYWPNKITNLINTEVNPKNSPDNIFSMR